MDKRKLSTAMEVLQEVSIEFVDRKKVIDRKLEQKRSKESMFVEEIIHFSSKSLLYNQRASTAN